MSRALRVWLLAALVGLGGVACGGIATPPATSVPASAGQSTAPSVATPSPAPLATTPATVTSPLVPGTATVSGGASAVAPALRIVAPVEGASLTLPAEVRYEIVGFGATLPAGTHLHALVGDPATGDRLELALAGPTGVTTLPDDKTLPGRRDVTFQIAQPDHTPFSNPQASVTIRDLIFAGRR